MAYESGISNDDYFTIIFDGNNQNEWQMAGKGKFVVLRGDEEEEEEQSIILQFYFYQTLSKSLLQ